MDLREAKNLSILQLAAVTKIDDSNLSKYENGRREPGLGSLILIANGLGIDVRKLMDFEFEIADGE